MKNSPLRKGRLSLIDPARMGDGLTSSLVKFKRDDRTPFAAPIRAQTILRPVFRWVRLKAGFHTGYFPPPIRAKIDLSATEKIQVKCHRLKAET